MHAYLYFITSSVHSKPLDQLFWKEKESKEDPSSAILNAPPPPPPAHTPFQHPGLTTIKVAAPRGSYGHNTGDPWTNSSGKDPYPPLEKPNPRKRQPTHSTPRHSSHPQHTKQALPLAQMSILGAITGRIWRTPGPISLAWKIKERIPKFSHPQNIPPLPIHPINTHASPLSRLLSPGAAMAIIRGTLGPIPLARTLMTP